MILQEYGALAQREYPLNGIPLRGIPGSTPGITGEYPGYCALAKRQYVINGIPLRGIPGVTTTAPGTNDGVYQDYCALPKRSYALSGVALYAVPGVVLEETEEPHGGGYVGGWIDLHGELDRAWERWSRYHAVRKSDNELMELIEMIVSSGLLD